MATAVFGRSRLARDIHQHLRSHGGIDNADASALSDLPRRHAVEVFAAPGHREAREPVGSHGVQRTFRGIASRVLADREEKDRSWRSPPRPLPSPA